MRYLWGVGEYKEELITVSGLLYSSKELVYLCTPKMRGISTRTLLSCWLNPNLPPRSHHTGRHNPDQAPPANTIYYISHAFAGNRRRGHQDQQTDCAAGGKPASQAGPQEVGIESFPGAPTKKNKLQGVASKRPLKIQTWLSAHPAGHLALKSRGHPPTKTSFNRRRPANRRRAVGASTPNITPMTLHGLLHRPPAIKACTAQLDPTSAHPLRLEIQAGGMVKQMRWRLMPEC